MNSSEEVKARKKEIFPLLYLMIGITLIMIIIGAIFPDVIFIWVIPLLGVMACIFLLRVMNKAAEKFKDIECPNCKNKIDFDENVQIEVLDRHFTVTKSEKIFKENDVPVESKISVIGKEHITVKVSCKCQKCGTEKNFTHQFVSVECGRTDRVYYINSGAMLIQYEKDVRNEAKEGFEGKSAGTTINGVNIKYIRTPESLVKGYFDNEILFNK